MEIDIKRLGHVLFFPFPHYLDMSTGKIYSQSILSVPDESMMLLPVYTCAPIYQQYIETLFAENRGIDCDILEKYPKFEHRNIQYQSDITNIEYEFTDEAYHFLENLRIDAKSYDDDYYSELAYYQDYEENYMIDFAIKWCEQKGYEGDFHVSADY